jgi:hypothetical protein
VLKQYAYHKPSDASLHAIDELREAFSEVTKAVQRYAPQSRERSVALTELETAAMWSIKAIVMNDSSSAAEGITT